MSTVDVAALPLPAVVSGLVQEAPPRLAAFFRGKLDTCVASTRCAVEVLTYFGVEARPLAVRVESYNPVAVEMMRQGASGEDLRAASLRHGPEDTTGPWGVGIEPDGPDGLGHLVAWLPGSRTVVDLTLGQAARPAKSMPLRPLALALDDRTPGFPTPGGRTPDATVTLDLAGCLVLYVAYPTARPWLRSRDWRPSATPAGLRAEWRQLIGGVIRAVREEVSRVAAAPPAAADER